MRLLESAPENGLSKARAADQKQDLDENPRLAIETDSMHYADRAYETALKNRGTPVKASSISWNGTIR